MKLTKGLTVIIDSRIFRVLFILNFFLGFILLILASMNTSYAIAGNHKIGIVIMTEEGFGEHRDFDDGKKALESFLDGELGAADDIQSKIIFKDTWIETKSFDNFWEKHKNSLIEFDYVLGGISSRLAQQYFLVKWHIAANHSVSEKSSIITKCKTEQFSVIIDPKELRDVSERVRECLVKQLSKRKLAKVRNNQAQSHKTVVFAHCFRDRNGGMQDLESQIPIEIQSYLQNGFHRNGFDHYKVIGWGPKEVDDVCIRQSKFTKKLFYKFDTADFRLEGYMTVEGGDYIFQSFAFFVKEQDRRPIGESFVFDPLESDVHYSSIPKILADYIVEHWPDLINESGP